MECWSLYLWEEEFLVDLQQELISTVVCYFAGNILANTMAGSQIAFKRVYLTFIRTVACNITRRCPRGVADKAALVGPPGDDEARLMKRGTSLRTLGLSAIWLGDVTRPSRHCFSPFGSTSDWHVELFMPRWSVYLQDTFSFCHRTYALAKLIYPWIKILNKWNW